MLKRPQPLFAVYAFLLDRTVSFVDAADRMKLLLVREGLHTKGLAAIPLLKEKNPKKTHLFLELATSLVRRIVPSSTLQLGELEDEIEKVETWKSAGMGASMLHLFLSAIVFLHVPHHQAIVEAKGILENTVFKTGHGILFPELASTTDKKILDAEKACLF